MKKNNIRNFCIIAHIDHGKSTLADRILEITGALEKREMQSQILDTMELERERGITIKLNAVQLNYKYKNSNYYLNLIDTPGHVDFSYEVSRSLAACEGAILVVDASQGIQAQTIANVYLAIENNLDIFPVINKVDLPTANVDKVKKEIKDLIGLDVEDIPLISAKTGLNVEKVIEDIILKLSPPNNNDNKPLKALIFDSYFDPYLGVILFIKVEEGILKNNDKILFMANQQEYTVHSLGIRNPKIENKKELKSGEVGWVSASIKSIKDVNVGDTITNAHKKADKPLPGYKQIQPMVYCGLYPTNTLKYKELKEALAKIILSDASLIYEPETSQALGFGFRCGFLGLLHMDIIQERLEREYNLNLITTAPSVSYKIHLTNNEIIDITNPSEMPATQNIKYIQEPYIKMTLYAPLEYIGPIMELCQNKRGIFKSIDTIDQHRNIITYEMPLNEIVFDFFDKLKSSTKGYASFDYEFIEYRNSKLVKMNILLNSNPVDALSTIVHKKFAFNRGKLLCRKLKDIIPRENFEIPVQAAINNKVIARETIKAVRKNVIAKCYGGDITRKKKLLQKQKEGKKRLKAVGSVNIPQDAFMAVLKLED